MRALVAIAFSALTLQLPVSAAPVSGAPKDFEVTYLTSDGSIPSEHLDLEFKNGWGIARSANGPFWVAVNEANMVVVIDKNGMPQNLRVTTPGAPTGIVRYDGEGFVVTDGGVSAPSRFLMAMENGKIAGWNSTVGPVAPDQESFVVIDRSRVGASYKGLAVASTVLGDRLYATDFHNGRVDVFDGGRELVTRPGAFVDPRLPAGYAPFGIQMLEGKIFVSYAKQDAARSDELHGQGLGIVDVYDTDGTFVARVSQHGKLNAPWGMAIAPAGFGAASGKLLVGNFGDGTILTFDMTDDLRRFTSSGELHDAARQPLEIDGLWGIAFGNNGAAGAENALTFAAGPADESHGSYGRVTVVTVATTP